ncbi:ribonuclease Z [Clostridium sartagoforme]|uniref:Ribonuclease Z n=1 Tax=Clostridium sartagoforme TaxID=84031 RepID=A0A4S2DPT7_9CLOT|nr:MULTISPECIES: ribonuclease Z [Clostridium]MBS5938378.1 ribonuclease Z [Clostridium sp.]TGY44438.1 ribonuclease Z [Clostridium sartagoforme]
MIDLTLLGCGGGMPMPNRHLSSLFININGRKILIDVGEGTQVAIRKNNLGFKAIDIILITHVHGDHIVGLPGLLSTIGNSGREEKLIIVGPEGITNVIKGLSVLFPYLPYKLEIIENPRELSLAIKKNFIEISEKDRSDLIINTEELNHSAPCIGYSLYLKRKRKFNLEKAVEGNVPKVLWSKLQREEKIEHNGLIYNSSMVLGDERRGIKLSYITDTRPTDKIIDLIENSDLFICEGTYGSDEDIEKAIKNKHMTFREAGILAKDSNAEELLLTHFSPAMNEPIDFIDNAKSVFNNTIIGEDGMKKALKFED